MSKNEFRAVLTVVFPADEVVSRMMLAGHIERMINLGAADIKTALDGLEIDDTKHVKIEASTGFHRVPGPRAKKPEPEPQTGAPAPEPAEPIETALVGTAHPSQTRVPPPSGFPPASNAAQFKPATA